MGATKSKILKYFHIQCYATTNNADEEECDKFYEKLQHTLYNIPKRDIKIDIEDVNAKIGQTE